MITLVAPLTTAGDDGARADYLALWSIVPWSRAGSDVPDLERAARPGGGVEKPNFLASFSSNSRPRRT